MSSIECPLLYIATMVFSLSALLMFFSLDGWFMFCFSWMICAEAFRNAAHSSGSAPNISNTSAALVSGNKSPRLSTLSWMETIRTTFTRQNSMNAASSREPRRALLNLASTISSPRSILAISCFHWGRSFSCPFSSSITCTQPYCFIHSTSVSKPS